MSGSPASASPDPRPGERVLLCGVNWIGDTIMSLPAIQAYRRRHPRVHLAVLVKPGLAPLWKLHAAPDELLTFEESPPGTFRAASMIRHWRFDRACVLPNSFRSALIPFLAGVPRRAGAAGHARAFLLTETVDTEGDAASHQALEYYRLLTPDAVPAEPERPALAISSELAVRADALLAAAKGPRVALLPGAARGPSKRWPAERFAAVGRRLAEKAGCGIVVLGSPSETDLAENVCRAVGPAAVNLGGRCSLGEWAAVLRSCRVAIANDSGGMHVAAAAGTPVVALYGLTDPRRTGPLGPARILQAGGQGARDIARRSAAAEKNLAAITAEQVYEAALELLRGKGETTN
jgi:heptosyltransferase-2